MVGKTCNLEDKEEAREQKNHEDIRRNITLQPKETRMALPGDDFPDEIMPESVRRQVEGRRSLDATLENPEFQAFLEEAAGGYEAAPPPEAKVGDERQALVDDIASITSGGARPPTPSAPARSEASGLPEDMTAALESSMQRGAAPAPTSPVIPTASGTTAPKTIQDRISGILGTLEARYKKEEEDIKKAEEDIEARYGGRSVGKKFLDRLIRALTITSCGSNAYD